MPSSRLKFQTLNRGQRIDVINGITYGRASLVNAPYSIRHLHNGIIQRYEVRAGDRGYSGDAANGNERAELVTYRAGAGNGVFGPTANFGEDYWLSFGFMIEPGDPILATGNFTTQNLCVGQFHDMQDPGDTVGLSPPLLFQLDPGTDTIGYRTRIRWDKALQQTGANYMTFTDVHVDSIVRGTWIRNVLRVRFGINDDAQLQIWRNGSEILNLSGINIGFGSTVADPKAAYWQNGIYRSSQANTLAVQYANLEQGTTSLFSRVANPLPIPTI